MKAVGIDVRAHTCNSTPTHSISLVHKSLRAKRVGALLVKQLSYGLVVVVLAALGAGAGAAARANPDLATLLASAIPSERPASVPTITLPSFPPELPNAKAKDLGEQQSDRSVSNTSATPTRPAVEPQGTSPWRPVADDTVSAPLAQADSPERPASVPEGFSPTDPVPAIPTSTPSQSPQAAALAEIDAIRKDMLELLSRLAVLEAQLAAGTYSAPDGAIAPTSEVAPSGEDAEVSTSGNISDDPGSAQTEAIAADGQLEESSTSPEDTASEAVDDSEEVAAAPSLQVGTQTISLPGDVLFDIDRADIRPEAAQLLAEVAQSIQQDYGSGRIRVIGHTDNTGAKDYNMALSLKRANAVKGYLTELMADASDNYSWTAVGNGPNSPVSDNSSRAGRQLNRRVDLVIAP
ncbi:MAG: OmpA family protein [Cyanobacteria bacterium P01_D01_bin.123]